MVILLSMKFWQRRSGGAVPPMAVAQQYPALRRPTQRGCAFEGDGGDVGSGSGTTSTGSSVELGSSVCWHSCLRQRKS